MYPDEAVMYCISLALFGVLWGLRQVEEMLERGSTTATNTMVAQEVEALRASTSSCSRPRRKYLWCRPCSSLRRKLKSPSATSSSSSARSSPPPPGHKPGQQWKIFCVNVCKFVQLLVKQWQYSITYDQYLTDSVIFLLTGRQAQGSRSWSSNQTRKVLSPAQS